ncbi:putative inorganic phosphate cotransporter [Trichoplusia ni]|uniref:Putative inorganic phosphate cotransporter n=1 Tax=Trichoplusia ni TaxID=7111 RepID=A0A7E5W383_TRINI|nr:putative inorganic phosphate cotransporter [Trichoplusia ni]
MLDQDVINLKPKSMFGVRHVQTVMLLLAMMICYGMRVNMSMAIVAMTDTSQDHYFDWSMQTQGVILSSFFWGYVVLLVPAGELAARFGGRLLVSLAVIINSVISLLLPLCAYYGGWQLVCGCRIVQGLSQGFLTPSVYNLIGKWAPIEEKSRMGSMINAGAHLGIAFQLIVSGFIAGSWGWPAIFYVNGALGIIWLVAYSILGSDSPQKSKFISKEERLYVQTSLGHVGEEKKKLKTPWKAIFTSIPFISLIILHSGQNWGYYTLMTEMPSYMNKILNVDIKANGVMSAVPYLAVYILSFPFGYISDYLPNHKILSVTATRKLSSSIGHYGPAIALIVLSYVPAGNITLAVAVLTIVVGLNVGHITGVMMVHLDMGPNFVATLFGISNMLSNIVSILATLAAGFMLQDETNPSDWKKVFYTTSAIYVVTNTLFLVFGTSEIQTWNYPPQETEINDTGKYLFTLILPL